MERLAVSKSFSYKTNYSPDEIMTLCCSRLTQLGYRLEQTENNTPQAIDGRNASKALAAGLVPFSPTLAAVYWFASPKNKIQIDVTKKGEFTITYEGKKALFVALDLCNMIRNSEAQTIQPLSTICHNCGAQIVEGAIYCGSCGQEIH